VYTLAVQRDFIAQHYLVGGDWGDENSPHAHHYRLELQMEADTLDNHGYCVDIVAVEAALDAFVARYRDKMLNDQPAFAGINPSIEHFTRIACNELAEQMAAPNLTALRVRIWENDIAWAAFTIRLR
jgi:6-pyruvoyltetrahydropterin/6-carboxytetrahydropterin synthase